MNFTDFQYKIKHISESAFEYKLTEKSKKIFFAISLIVTFLAVLSLNLKHPLFTDDWEYIFCERLYDCGNKYITSNEKISSITDIFKSQYNHYFMWGGRSVNHSVAQFLLLIGSPFNKILNALVYVFFTYIIYNFSKKKNEKLKISSYLLINILIFFSSRFSDLLYYGLQAALIIYGVHV